MLEDEKLLALIDAAPIAECIDQTDRVFVRYEFDGLRAAIEKAELKESP